MAEVGGTRKVVQIRHSPSPYSLQGIPFAGTTCLTEVNHPASTTLLPCSDLTAPSRYSHFSWKSAAGSSGGGEKESGGSLFPIPLLAFINGFQSILYLVNEQV